ncbi:MAG TPA: hypothetical protein VJ440_01950 [Candidatus Brocadiaceae bacterium]|nr:hypothetical protein [Candidatus Brocadiaceae bacterium]
MEQSKKKRFTGLIAVLLLLIATVLCWRAYKEELWGRRNFGDVDSQRAFLLMGET